MEFFTRMWRGNEKSDNRKEFESEKKLANEWFLFPKSLDFSGQEWIKIPSHPKLDLTNEMTMMAWIYPTIYGDQRIFCKSIAGNDSEGYGIDTHDLRLRFLGSEGIGINCFSSNEKLALNSWQHVACTFTTSSGLKLYINGNLVGERKATGPLKVNHLPLCIGNSPVGAPGSGLFRGQMTQMSLWNIALSQHQICEYKDKWLSKDYKGIVLYYPFINNAASDFSGNGLHGIANGMRGFVQVKQLGSLPWSQERHTMFPQEFKDVVFLLLMAHNKQGNVFNLVPKELIIIIIYNMSVQ